MQSESDYESVVQQRDALAVENVALKSLSIKLFNLGYLKGHESTVEGYFTDIHRNDIDTYHDDDVAEIIEDEVETQATDAFMDEVRAQVWIEGNEPAEFGRYWVRYETDVGPQYCSAKWMEYNFCAGSDTNIHKIWLSDHSRSINSLKGVTNYTMLPEPIEGGAK